MKQTKLILLCLLLLAGCAKKQYTACGEGEEKEICYVEESQSYQLEENAVIRIGGLPTALANEIMARWDEEFPQAAGLIVAGDDEDVLSAVRNKESYDIFLADEEAVVLNRQGLMELHDKVYEQVYPKKDKSSGGDVVLDEVKKYYMPVSYIGMYFYYNKTMLDALGTDTATDENADGIPDAFDTFEEIFAMADAMNENRPVYKKKKVEMVFPFSLFEPYSSYFMLTNQGFRIFEDNQGIAPGFDTPAFLEALSFIEEAGKHVSGWKKDGRPFTSADYIWRWEQVYTNQIAPFGMAMPWMDLYGAMAANQVEYIAAPHLPTFRESALTPFVTTQGFVINANTAYPSAAQEVMRFLRSEVIMQLLIDNSSFIPYEYNDHHLDFSLMPNKEAAMKSLAMSDSISMIALPGNVYKKAMNAYYEIDLFAPLRKLWDQEITKEEAQQEIMGLFDQWLITNNLRSKDEKPKQSHAGAKLPSKND